MAGAIVGTTHGSQYVPYGGYLNGTAGPKVGMSGELRERLKALTSWSGRLARVPGPCFCAIQVNSGACSPFYSENYFLYILVALLKHDFFSPLCPRGSKSALSLSVFSLSIVVCSTGTGPVVTMSLSSRHSLCGSSMLYRSCFVSFLFFRKNHSTCGFGVSVEKVNSGSSYVVIMDHSFLTHLFLKSTENHLHTNALQLNLLYQHSSPQRYYLS